MIVTAAVTGSYAPGYRAIPDIFSPEEFKAQGALVIKHSHFTSSVSIVAPSFNIDTMQTCTAWIVIFLFTT